MLRINLPPTSPKPITPADFKNYHLPEPSKGVKEKGKDQVFLKKGSNKLMKEKASTLELLPSNY